MVMMTMVMLMTMPIVRDACDDVHDAGKYDNGDGDGDHDGDDGDFDYGCDYDYDYDYDYGIDDEDLY